jgi:GT2 family glycosyltransferase/SAM-dependent methyltransferase
MIEPVTPAVVHVDLAAGLPDLGELLGGRDGELVLWLGDIPLGSLRVGPAGLSPRALADAIAHQIARPVGERLVGDGFHPGDPSTGIPESKEAPDFAAVLALDRPLAALAEAARDDTAGARPRVTLAICTRGRPADLARCLESIARAAPGPDELLVVDNAPSADTRAVVERFDGARYVPEPRPGLSAARNAAVAAASGDVLAFVDDDTEVHPRWLERLCAPFADPEVVAVTGLVLPAALDTPAQVRFERLLGGFARGYQPLTYDPAFMARTRAIATPVWKVGAGANMAVRMDALRRVGPFDERLGAGAAGCSEDSELWYRLIAAGWTCRYEPGSVVHHHHRSDDAALRRQAHDYIRGHVAALFVQYARYRHVGNLRRALAAIPRWLLAQARREATAHALEATGLVPRRLHRPIASELAGYVRGLSHLPLALTPPSPPGKTPLREFLARNPYPRPRTEGFFYREKMRAIHRVAPETSPAEVLEVGGGRSGLARMLYPGAQITNIDLDPSYADAPPNQDPRVRFVTGDATALPFDDASFDVVTMFDLLEHVPDDRAAAAEALRVLRPGGHVVVSSPNLRWHSPYHGWMRPICPDDAEMMARWGHVRRGYSLADLAALFGRPPDMHADFINRITAIGHDVSFSRLPDRPRRALGAALSPLVWAGYLLQPRSAPGTETAASWRKPAA